MLKAVIQNENVNWMVGLETISAQKSIRPDTESRAATKATFEKFHFIARSTGTTVAATEDSNLLSFCQELLRQP